MSGNYVQVLPDSSGKKVEAIVLQADTDTISRQVVTLAERRDIEINEALQSILEELRETRRVLCEATRVHYTEL